jgi:hypothetical protein
MINSDDYLVHPDEKSLPPYKRRSFNPFDMGPIGNCIDFWGKGAGELRDISWFSIYDVPAHLMKKATKRSVKKAKCCSSGKCSTKSGKDVGQEMV